MSDVNDGLNRPAPITWEDARATWQPPQTDTTSHTRPTPATPDESPLTALAFLETTRELAKQVRENVGARIAGVHFSRSRIPNAKPARAIEDLMREPSPYAHLGPASRLLGLSPSGLPRLAALTDRYSEDPPGLATTTRQAQAMQPLLVHPPIARSAPDIQHRGVLWGTDMNTGAPVIFDPHELYGPDLPVGNMIVAGDTNNGKTSLTKTLVLRLAGIGGRQVMIISSKPQMLEDADGHLVDGDEWTPVALAGKWQTIRLDKSGNNRINPLDPRIARDARAAERLADPDPERAGRPSRNRVGQDTLLMTILSQAGRGIAGERNNQLTSQQIYAVTRALSRATNDALAQGAEPEIRLVGHYLRNPNPDDAAHHNLTERELREWGIGPALTIDRLLGDGDTAGDLAGLADGPTTIDIDLDADVIHWDLSALDPETDEMPIAMAIIGAFIQHTWLRHDDDRRRRPRYLVLEEGWHIIENPSVARLFRVLFKFWRALGLVNIATIHRPDEDIPLATAANKDARAILKEVGVFVVYHVNRSQQETIGKMFGMEDSAITRLSTLRRGQAAVRFGDHPTRFIEHVRSRTEEYVTDTDAAMTGNVVPERLFTE